MKRLSVVLALALGLLLPPQSGSGDPYTFETSVDLVPPDPRLWFALQSGWAFNAWSTTGVDGYRISALEANPGTEFAAPCTMQSFLQAGCSASTAMTDLVAFNLGLSPVHHVSWRLTWYPRSSAADVRLVLMDDGFANPVTLGTTEGEAKLDRAYTVGGDITEAWNAHVGGPHKYLGFASKGDGSAGPVIYQLRVKFVHRIP